MSSIALTNVTVNRNYELVTTSLSGVTAPDSVKISPKALDIPAQALIYNGTTSYAVEDYATGVGSETITLTYTPTIKDAGVYTLGAADKGFTLALSDGNYSVKSTGTLTVEPKPLTAPAKTVTYNGGVSFTQEVDGVNGEKVAITYTANNKNAASYTYWGSAGTGKYTAAVGSANYTVTGGGTLKIEPKSIAAVWTGENGSRADFSWAYDGDPHAPTAAAATGVDGETVTLSIVGASTDYKESAYTATASIDPANGNYTLTDTTQTFNITKADYDMSGVTFVDAFTAYDGGAHSLTVTGTLPTGADGKPVTVSYSGSATNVSEGAVTVTATFSTESTNYNTPDAKTAEITVTPKPLTITANDHTITYGDALTDNGVSYSGFVTGEASTNLGGTLGYDYDYTRYGDIGNNYTLTPKGVTAANYAIAFKSGALTVSPRPITVTIADKSSVYGAQLQALTATVTEGSIVNSDSVYSLASTATRMSDVGDFAITGTKANSNYAVTFVGSDGTAGKYSITNAALTGISITGYSGTYDGQSHDADGSKSATTVNGQPVTWKFGTTADAYMQDHLSVQNVADSGTYYYKVSAPNHTTVTGSFTATVSAKDISGTTVTLGDALTYTGSEQTQEVTGVTIDGLKVTYEVSGNKKTAANTYTLTVTGTGNFTGTQTQQFSIAPKPVTLTWDYTEPFTYDAAAKAITATVSNQIEGDTFTLVYTNNRYTAADSYTATVTGLGNSNYTLTGGANVSKEWRILKAPISFTVTGDSYEYSNTSRTASVVQTTNETPSIGSGFTVGYKLAAEDIADATASKTDAGDYDIIVTLSDGNFMFDGQPDTVRSMKVGTLTIGKKPVTAQWKNLIHVYDGTAKAPVFDINSGDVFSAERQGVSVQLGANAKTAAGTYTVTASLTGSRAANYELTNPTGSLIIQKAPVTFTISDNSVPHDGSGHLATVTATVSGSLFTNFTVSYKNANGETVVEPTDAGSYGVYAAIASSDHRHADAADGAARKIGVLTIYRAAQPHTYTVSFTGGEGATGNMDALFAALAETPRVLPENLGFTKENNRFGGWKYGARVYQPGESLTQPAANITLTAVWIEETYLIEGVVDENGKGLSDVVVTLMLGSRQISQTETDGAGEYSFADIAPGLYNLVASKNGVTKTILVEIVTANETGKNITIPAQRTNSVVEVSAGSPAIVVGELEQTFETTQENPCYTSNDATVVTAGGAVEIKLTASATTVAQDAIEDAASGTVGLYLDMTLTKTVTPAGSEPNEPTVLDESATLLEMIISLPGELQRKDSYAVYRSHSGEVQALTAYPNDAGEYIAVNAEKTAITVYAKYFSTYAIAFTTYSDGTATTYKPVITPTEHGSVAVQPATPAAGAKVTVMLTPEAGFEPSSVKVTDRNGNKVALTQNSDGTYCFTQPAGAVTITAHFRAVWNPFTDVKLGNWFHDDVRYVYENGLMQSTGSTAFSPRLDTSRGMIATILWRMEGEPAATTPMTFMDVDEGKYYHTAVAWAAAHGIVEGYSALTFGPEDPITREQMATILYRYAKYRGYDMTASADLNKFGDINEISAWALPAMCWVNAEGLITGKSGAILDPQDNAERCQVAAILHRFCENKGRSFSVPNSRF